MKLTAQQKEVIAHQGDMKINAVAGSGKTTTLMAYAQARPKNKRILYLAFNKSVKLEAEKKFAENGLHNVKVETAHSLAYKKVFNRSKYQLHPTGGYKTHEIQDILGFDPPVKNDPHTGYILANHVNKFVAYFCNSKERKVSQLDYLLKVSDPKAKGFVERFYEQILQHTRQFLAKMYRGEIAITHDFYLKQFQLKNPTLPYDYLLFDEGQDASPVMLDVFLHQQGTKVIVGDTHQQIYGWRHAINSLAQVDFPDFELTQSFRFDPEVAMVAMRFLKLKNLFMPYTPRYIMGMGNNKSLKTRATLARTNLSLLTKAIELVFEKKSAKQIYFEGNINSYTYADEGASVYDVLSLYNDEKHRIRDKLIKSMPSFEALKDYVEKTEDGEMKMLTEVVTKYKNRLPYYIKNLKTFHVENNQKEKADMIFSTVHRCKGMEYDEVNLTDDFMSEARLKKILSETVNKDILDTAQLAEEINLLYVAVTRTKNQLNIPFGLKPSEQKINWTFNNHASTSTSKQHWDELDELAEENDDESWDIDFDFKKFSRKKWR